MSNTNLTQYRTLERHEFIAQCRMRTIGSLARLALVRNLTSDGCALQCIPTSMQRGDTIFLQFGKIGPVEGRVVWLKKGAEAGIRFEQGLHPAVFDRLLHLAHRNMVLGGGARELVDMAPVAEKAKRRMAPC